MFGLPTFQRPTWVPVPPDVLMAKGLAHKRMEALRIVIFGAPFYLSVRDVEASDAR